MRNTQTLATALIETPGGCVRYDGPARIDGVPGTHAPIPIEFADVAGSSCGALLPTGNVSDIIEGTKVTCIDNGMPVVCITAADLGLSGEESPAELEGDAELTKRVEAIRVAAGPLMNLGDVTGATVPKMSLLSPPAHGGTVSTRTFIPHRVHEAIGVLGAVSVATACVLPGSVAHEVADVPDKAEGSIEVEVEHPTGFFTVTIEVAVSPGGTVTVSKSALLRTARLLMRGEVLVPSSVWTQGGFAVIIDCHGHYTTAPAAHMRGAKPARGVPGGPPGTGLPGHRRRRDPRVGRGNQLRLLAERGADMTIFSPRASAMGHHVGDEAVSGTGRGPATTSSIASSGCTRGPSSACASCRSRPGCRSAKVHRRAKALRHRTRVRRLQPQPRPKRGPLDRAAADRQELVSVLRGDDRAGRAGHGACLGNCKSELPRNGAHYINADTTAFMQFLQGDLFADFPALTW